jgi:hypothetical protein
MAETQGDPKLMDAIFQDSLKTAWGTLLLTSSPHCSYWSDEGNRDAYLEAVFRHWDEIGPIGPRYAFLSCEPRELLESPTMLRWALFHASGLSEELGRRTNWTELFHDMKSKWERKRAG